MGVMACNRKGCENIMCDTYTEEAGYICNDCKATFEDKMAVKEYYTRDNLVKQLKEFMKSNKVTERGSEITTVKKFFGDGPTVEDYLNK